MNRNFSITGFVLSRRNLGEADRIVTFFSREQGKLSLSARGVRRASAKLTSQLEPYAEVRLQCVETRGIPIITGAAIQQSLQPVGEYEVLIEAQAVLELTSLTIDDGQADELWYEHLLAVLTVLANIECSQETRQLAWLGLMIHSIDALGLTPELPTEAVAHGFDIREGTFHRGRVGAQLSTGALKLWRFLVREPVAGRLRITGAVEAVTELTPVIEQFWGYHTGLTLKTRSLA